MGLVAVQEIVVDVKHNKNYIQNSKCYHMQFERNYRYAVILHNFANTMFHTEIFYGE